MMLMPSRTLNQTFSSPHEAKAAFEALNLETGKKFEKNAQTKITLNQKTLSIQTNAVHDRALQASQASYAKLVSFVERLTHIQGE